MARLCQEVWVWVQPRISNALFFEKTNKNDRVMGPTRGKWTTLGAENCNCSFFIFPSPNVACSRGGGAENISWFSLAFFSPEGWGWTEWVSSPCLCQHCPAEAKGSGQQEVTSGGMTPLGAGLGDPRLPGSGRRDGVPVLPPLCRHRAALSTTLTPKAAKYQPGACCVALSPHNSSRRQRFCVRPPGCKTSRDARRTTGGG